MSIKQKETGKSKPKTSREIHDIPDYKIVENAGGINVKSQFAKRLNDLLTENEIPQKEFCIDTGISTGSLSYYRTGQREPIATTLASIAKYFKVSTDYLLGLTEISDDPDAIDINRLGLSDYAIEQLEEMRENHKDTMFLEGSVVVETYSILEIINILLEELNALQDTKDKSVLELIGEILGFERNEDAQYQLSRTVIKKIKRGKEKKVETDVPDIDDEDILQIKMIKLQRALWRLKETL